MNLDHKLVLIERYLGGDAQARGKLLTSFMSPLRDYLNYAEGHLDTRQRLSDTIELMDAVLVHFDGTEVYDRTAAGSIRSDVKSLLAESKFKSAPGRHHIETLAFIKAFKRPAESGKVLWSESITPDETAALAKAASDAMEAERLSDHSAATSD